ncbi:MAG TPA: GPW/gp25 family protein [Anaerolineae bacterium]|nr:GPW/gp25 family protein [Anaerolineae bacterium]
MAHNPIIGRGWRFPPALDERGTVALVSDEAELDQAVHIILGTAPGQRIMRPEFGCRIHELVFAPNNAATAGAAARYVGEALARWEPRIRVQRIEAEADPADQARLLIAIEYRVVATRSSRTLVYPFYLIPEREATSG